MKRIGEILVERGWVTAATLARAVAKQREFPRRLCSLLIATGMLGVDEASRALGEQHGVAAALQRHLEHRDRALVRLLPAELARSTVALPIGRMGNGTLIVCVRDPHPHVAAALAAVLGEPIVMAVAPAGPLEALIGETYGAEDEGFEVDLSTGPIATLDLEPMTEPEDPMFGFTNLTLVGLDDHGVTRDPTQSELVPVGPHRTSTLPPPVAPRPLTQPPPAAYTEPQAQAPSPQVTQPIELALGTAPAGHLAIGTDPPSRRFVSLVSLPETVEAVTTATSREDATAAAMRFMAARWRAALLLAVGERSALGELGHGNQLPEDVIAGLAIPLSAPSIISAALSSGHLTTTLPPDPGAVQDRLERLLGMPRFPAAIPIVVAAQRAYVLVTGDPIAEDTGAATADLDLLAEALGSAYTRLST